MRDCVLLDRKSFHHKMDIRLVLFFFLISAVYGDNSFNIEKEIAKSNRQFTLKIYNHLMGAEGNIVMSPTAAQILLTLVENGARGDTHLEMCKTLSLLDIDLYLPHIAMGLMNTLNATKSATINLAGLSYFDSAVELKPKFFIVAELAYNVMVKVADLSNKELISEDINRWVSTKTKDEITQIMHPWDVGNGILLMNSLYFQGRWKYPFTDLRNTAFFMNEVQSKKMEAMSRKGIFKHAISIDLDAELIQIPYEEEDVVLIIVLPRKRDGLFAMEPKLSYLFSEEQQWKKTHVHLTIPKFRFENTVHLKPILQELGMEKAFSSDADFSGISDTKIFISTVIQKTYIEVGEHGSSVSPAPVVVEEEKESSPNWRTFMVDHPFIFMVEHVLTKTILHFGRMVN